MTDAELTYALLAPNWGGVPLYALYNIRDPQIVGVGSQVEILSDASDATYVEVLAGSGFYASIFTFPWVTGSHQEEFELRWPNMPAAPGDPGDTYDWLSYRLNTAFGVPEGGVITAVGFRAACVGSGPFPEGNPEFSQPPRIYLIGVTPGGEDGVEAPSWDVGTQLDDTFRDYEWIAPGEGATTAEPSIWLYYRYIRNDEEDQQEWTLTVKVSRVWLIYTMPGDVVGRVVLPPLRRIQRGDGLAVGGVPRAVQNRSRQSSLRRSSAYP